MSIFLTRKPILNKNIRVVEYETITYATNNYDSEKLQELSNRIKKSTPNKKIYINIQDDLFKKGLIKISPDKLIGISILENQSSLEKILYICQELKSKGFSIMLGDFALNTDPKDYIDFVDIVKINLASSLPVRKRIRLKTLQSNNIKLIATNINNSKEYTRAIHDGFHYFQGSFYTEPRIIKKTSIPTQKLHYFNLLQEINQPEPDFDQIELIIKQDISLSYNLFRLVNSAYFGLRNEVRTIKQALMLLGLNDYKKWLTLKIMRGISEDKPNILIINSIIRANFAEKLAPYVNCQDRKLDFFLIGLFSLMDSFLGRPLSNIIDELPMAKDTRTALIKKTGLMGDIYKLVLSYENADWSEVIKYSQKYQIEKEDITESYVQAVEAANEVINALN